MQLIPVYLEQLSRKVEDLKEFSLKYRNWAIEKLAIEKNWRLISTPLALQNSDLKLLEDDLHKLLQIWLEILDKSFHSDWEFIFKKLGYDSQTTELLLKLFKPVNSNVFCRWDLALTEDGPKILELNIGSILGGLGSDLLGEFNFTQFLKNKNIDRATENSFTCFDMLTVLAKNIGQHLNEITVDSGLCVVEDDDNFEKFKNTLHLLANYVKKVTRRPVIVAKTSDLVLKNGNIMCQGKKIDIIYSFFTIEDILAKPDVYKDIVESISSGLIRQIYGFEYVAYGNKLIMAILNDPDIKKKITANKIELVERLVPWTMGLNLETLEFGIKNQQFLVCKPVDSFGGHGVLCGWEVSNDIWQMELKSYLKKKLPYIFQKRVLGKKVDLVIINNDGSVELIKSQPILGIFFLKDKIIGGMVRARSDDGSVINVQQGGAVGAFLKSIK